MAATVSGLSCRPSNASRGGNIIFLHLSLFVGKFSRSHSAANIRSYPASKTSKWWEEWTPMLGLDHQFYRLIPCAPHSVTLSELVVPQKKLYTTRKGALREWGSGGGVGWRDSRRACAAQWVSSLGSSGPASVRSQQPVASLEFWRKQPGFSLNLIQHKWSRDLNTKRWGLEAAQAGF